MKKCTKCKIYKPLTEFRTRKDRKGYSSWCIPCFREYERERYKNCPKNRKRIRSNDDRRITKSRKYVWDHLLKNPCPCGESDPVVLEFDHRIPSTKIECISVMSCRGWAIETIKEEIEKCDVLCANCHRRKTAKQFGWYKEFLVL